jgi:purine-binding chemotaxis protein CheW
MGSKKKKQTRNALPHDPLEGIGELSSIIPGDAGTDEEVAVTLTQEDELDDKTSTRIVDVRESDHEAGSPVPVDGEAASAPETESEMTDPASDDSKQESRAQVDAPSAKEIDSESLAEADSPSDPSDTSFETDLMITEPLDDIEAVDTELKSEDGIEDVDGPLLDMLIATIDDDIDAAFGSNEGTELAPTQEGLIQEEQFVIFSLTGTEYAVPIVNVIEIGYPLGVTPLPNVPDWVLGVSNLRGDLISVVDLRMFFGLERTTFTESARMLVGRTSQEDLTIGLIVDQAQGIRQLPIEQIEKPTAGIESQISPYLLGTYEHEGNLLVVLDLDSVLASTEIRQFEPL